MKRKSFIWLPTDILDDPALHMLNHHAWRSYIELYAIAGIVNDEGRLPPVEGCAWLLRSNKEEVVRAIYDLLNCGLVRNINGVFVITRYEEDQNAYHRDPTSSSYKNYLNSNHWTKMRKKILTRACGCCEVCGAGFEKLEIHHLTYERLGREKKSDLLAVCPSCHRKLHSKEN